MHTAPNSAHYVQCFTCWTLCLTAGYSGHYVMLLDSISSWLTVYYCCWRASGLQEFLL